MAAGTPASWEGRIDMIGELHRDDSWGLLCAIALCLACGGNAVGADESKAQRDRPKAAIEKLGGGRLVLAAPLIIYGKFKAKPLVIHALNVELLESLVVAKDRKAPRTFVLTLRNGIGPFVVVAQEDAKIEGMGEWGRESVSFSKLASVKVTHTAPTAPFAKRYMWRCILGGDHEFLVGSNSGNFLDYALKGTVAGASLHLDKYRVRSVDFGRGVASVTTISGQTLEGWRPGSKALSATTAFGGVDIPWGRVKRLLKVKEPVDEGRRKARVPIQPDWRVKLREGPLVDVADPKPSDAKLNAEVIVTKLDWRGVVSVAPDEGGVRLTLVNKVKWLLSGRLCAATLWGRLEFQTKTVERMTRAAATTAQVDLAKGKAIVGAVRTVGGQEYKAASPKLVSSRQGDFGGLLVVESGPAELWVSSDRLLAYRLRVEKQRILTDMPILKRLGSLGGIEAITFENFMGAFRLPIKAVRDYLPQADPRAPHQTAKPKYEKPKYELKCKGRRRGVPDCAFSVSDIEFVRYPRTVWAGTYSYDPYSWSRADTLYFKRNDGGRVDVAFDRIRRIELTGGCYASGRDATLTNPRGAKLEGQVYPGDLGKEGYGGGVVSWNADKEGILGKIDHGLYVFVPFAKVRVIEITGLPGSEKGNP